MSLSDITSYGETLARTVIRRLIARSETGSDVVLAPGTVIEPYTIRRDVVGADVYSMEFRSGELVLQCGLVEFLARTELGRGLGAGSPGWSYAGRNAGTAS